MRGMRLVTVVSCHTANSKTLTTAHRDFRPISRDVASRFCGTASRIRQRCRNRSRSLPELREPFERRPGGRVLTEQRAQVKADLLRGKLCSDRFDGRANLGSIGLDLLVLNETAIVRDAQSVEEG